jgi:hypothetical protein
MAPIKILNLPWTLVHTTWSKLKANRTCSNASHLSCMLLSNKHHPNDEQKKKSWWLLLRMQWGPKLQKWTLNPFSYYFRKNLHFVFVGLEMQIGPKYVFFICILLKRNALETHPTPLVSKIMRSFMKHNCLSFELNEMRRKEEIKIWNNLEVWKRLKIIYTWCGEEIWHDNQKSGKSNWNSLKKTN